jgi:hypothetical protein
VSLTKDYGVSVLRSQAINDKTADNPTPSKQTRQSTDVSTKTIHHKHKGIFNPPIEQVNKVGTLRQLRSTRTSFGNS